MRTITRSDIHLTLSLLDVVPGDTILMHSALTAVGPIEGGADALIDAILEALGSDGTLVMSSLTGWSAPFDPDKTPSGVGYLSEVFRKRPGVLRSLHPVHSVIAFGKNAAYITADHDICETGCGEGSLIRKCAISAVRSSCSASTRIATRRCTASRYSPMRPTRHTRHPAPVYPKREVHAHQVPSRTPQLQSCHVRHAPRRDHP